MSIKTFVKTLKTERAAYNQIAGLSAIIAANLMDMTDSKKIYVGAHARPEAEVASMTVTDNDVLNLIHEWVASKEELEVRVADMGMYITLK